MRQFESLVAMFEDIAEWVGRNGPVTVTANDDPLTRTVGFYAVCRTSHPGDPPINESWGVSLTGLKRGSCQWAQNMFHKLRSLKDYSSIEDGSFRRDMSGHAAECGQCLTASVHET